MQMCAAAVLGVLQIVVGVVCLVLGPSRTHTRPGDVASLWAAYWLGAVFAAAGVFTIVSGSCRTVCLSRCSALGNLLGALFSITGLVLYSLDLAHVSLSWMCKGDSAPCMTLAAIAQKVLTWVDVCLLLLLLLQLCVNISAVVLSLSLREKVFLKYPV
uniref:Uncharacterized protein n=1 Tax=Knipowitschia caucasica TaxID=637954 RepID=A0AAV2MFT5_KNICA